MSDKKIKLAITHGDINGVGYEVIIKTFSDNRMMEMCTPILYGSSKIASYHKKLLPKQELNFTNVKDAKSSMDKKFNVVNIINEEVKIDLGKSTEIAGQLSLKALDCACEDLINENVDVLDRKSTRLNSSHSS